MFSLQRLFLPIVVAVYTLVSGIHGNSCPQICFCNSKLTSVNCEGKGLMSLPVGIPKSVTKLYLGHNAFTTLESFMFRDLKSLTYLGLGENKISRIQPFAFAGLHVLDKLAMNKNAILSVDKNAFSGMPGLTDLNLMSNRIQQIADGAFNDTSSLETLNLQANKFTVIPPIGVQPRLVSLVLSENGITDATFPDSYSKSKKLAKIALSQNSITSLTNKTFMALTENLLTKLALSPNKIHKIEAGTFSPLAGVHSLKLGFNPLDSQALKLGLSGLQGKQFISLNIANISLQGSLPSDTFELLSNATLTSLLMNSNSIQEIPDSAFSQLKNLITLDLSNNGIVKISDHAFQGLEKLNQLNLLKNRLTAIPNNLPRQLMLLRIYKNQIRQIDSETLKDMTSLQLLDVSHNNILTITGKAFAGLTGLQKLYLSHNQINTLPGGLFSSLVQLISLELNSNNLLLIQQQTGLFASQGKLIYLNLAGNQCGTFPIDMLNPLLSLRYLHLEGNNFGKVIHEDEGGLIFKGLKHLQDLYLMNNEISFLHNAAFQDLNQLRMLNVTGNKISKWGGHTFASCTALKTLDLSYNLISVLHENSLADLHLDQFNLTGNPFACTCDLRWFRDWIKQNTTCLTKLENYTCNTPKAWSGRRLLTFDRSKITCTFFTLTTIIAISASVFLVSIAIVFIVYHNRWRIRLNWYRLWHGKRRRDRKGRALGNGYEEIPGEEELFDAYISYSDEDERWVIDNLLPDIDRGELHRNKQFGGDFRLYFKERDSVPGSAKIADIDTYLTASKKMIVVLSNNYQTGLNELELSEAMELLYEHKLEDIVVVKIEHMKVRKIPKPLYRQMKQGRFLEWEDGEESIQVFKEEMKKRLRSIPEETV